MNQNLSCRIFAEQLKLVNQLPENERAIVLYTAINQSFSKVGYQVGYQDDKQNGYQNGYQNESAYISVSESLSEISKCVLDLLTKNIVFKEFSLNHGGKREGSGSKKGHPNNPSGKNQWTDKPKQQPTKEPVPTDEPLFEEFWKAYTPVAGKDGRFVSKGNKKSCQEKYTQQLRKGIKHETIINGLKQYLTYCANNGVCSCGAEVFINQRRWENDYSGTGVIQSVEPRGLHRQGVDIVEAARQFANGT